MQIRELTLKELYEIYDVVSHLREMSYEEFEDLIYDMRDMKYKMFGILERGELVTFAGVVVQTTLKDRRHLYVYDLVTLPSYDVKRYNDLMISFLNDYSKMQMCTGVIFSSELEHN